MSTGQLKHPELKRFGLTTPQVMLPPRPDAEPTYVAAAAVGYATADELISAHLGTSEVASTGNCDAYRTNLQRCFDTHGDQAEDQCQHYLQGLKRQC